MQKRFKSKLVGRGPNNAWVFLEIPFDVHQAYGSKARVPVAGTLNGFAFQNSLLPNGDGTHSMAVNKQLRAGAKAEAGDTVEVVMAPDTAERSVDVPADVKAALATPAVHKQLFAKLTYSSRKEFIDWIVDAKKPETRVRRIEKMKEMLVAGRKLNS